MKYLKYAVLASTFCLAVEAIKDMFKDPKSADADMLVAVTGPAVDGISAITKARIPQGLRQAIAGAVVNAVQEYYKPKAA